MCWMVLQQAGYMLQVLDVPQMSFNDLPDVDVPLFKFAFHVRHFSVTWYIKTRTTLVV